MMCQSIGLPPISTIGFGRTAVSSLSREPKPPARITAFTGMQVIGRAACLRTIDWRSWGRPLLRHQRESGYMPRLDPPEMAPVERRDRVETVALGECHDRRVHHSERQVEVLLNQLLDALPVGIQDRFDRKLAGRQRAREGKLGMRADAITEQIGDLGEDERGDEQRPLSAPEEIN